MTPHPARRKLPRRQTRLVCHASGTGLGVLVPLRVWSLGPGGAGLESGRGDVTVGETLELLLTLPGEPLRLMVDGEVVWAERDRPSGQPLRFGVRFDHGPLADFRLLNEFAYEAGEAPDPVSG